jgi:hypothetical protein
MRGIHKKLTSLIVALVLVCTALTPALAFANGTHADYLVYEIAAQLRAEGTNVPDWGIAACISSLHKEHMDCDGYCRKCTKRRAPFMGPLQMKKSWNKNGKGCACDGGHYDYRACLRCSIGKYLRVSATGSTKQARRSVRRQWPTCGFKR